MKNKKILLNTFVKKDVNISIYPKKAQLVDMHLYLYRVYKPLHWYTPWNKAWHIVTEFDGPYCCDTYYKDWPYNEWVYDSRLRTRNEIIKNVEKELKYEAMEWYRSLRSDQFVLE